MSMKILTIATLASALGLSSCMESPSGSLRKYSGIRPCAPANVSFGEVTEPDVLLLQVVTRNGCYPTVERSVNIASNGGCRGLIERGSCSYEYKKQTVVVERLGVDAGQSRYSVRIW